MLGLYLENAGERAAQKSRNGKAQYIASIMDRDGDSEEDTVAEQNFPLSEDNKEIEAELLASMGENAPIPPPAPPEFIKDTIFITKDLETLPFVLYLRPFALDGTISVPNPEISKLLFWTMHFYRQMVRERVDLEELLLRSLNDEALLVAIGHQNDLIGAGKVVTENSSWRKKFIRMALKSSAVISIPSLHASTLWELEWLARNEFFERTMMIFTEKHIKGESSEFNYENIAPRLREIGWKVPPTITTSSLVVFDKYGECRMHSPKTKFKKVKIARVLRGCFHMNDPKRRSDLNRERDSWADAVADQNFPLSEDNKEIEAELLASMGENTPLPPPEQPDGYDGMIRGHRSDPQGSRGMIKTSGNDKDVRS